MFGRINRNRKIFASVFLSGYLSFVLLSIIHFHNFEENSSDKVLQYKNSSYPETVTSQQDNCPVCHLFYSLSNCTIHIPAENDLTVESNITLPEAAGFAAYSIASPSLRAPPSFVFLSA